jgi:hypothetical protein
MKPQKIFGWVSAVFLLVGCRDNTVHIKNEKQGLLKPVVTLEPYMEKHFALDSNTAPRAPYTQMYIDSSGNRIFTFLNIQNNSIYFYDYTKGSFIKKIAFEDKAEYEPNGQLQPGGYYIKSMDSIYVYRMSMLKILLMNAGGKTLNTISLIGDKSLRKDKWEYFFPQYDPQTANPFIETRDALIFPGQYMGTIPENIIDSFRFVAFIDYKTGKVGFKYAFPRSLYGHSPVWGDKLLTDAYVDYVPEDNKMVFSFAHSHDLYTSGLNSNRYQKYYGGSNVAGTIESMHGLSGKNAGAKIMEHIIKMDEYGAIKYDRFRKVYYRVLMKGIDHPSAQTQWKDKEIVIIIMDDKFNYLGERVIGKWGSWYIQNIFVTSEGLNIEYIPGKLNEDILTLKIFKIKNIQ